MENLEPNLAITWLHFQCLDKGLYATDTIKVNRLIMENKQHPTFANGKIGYIEIPTNNIAESASFYNKVFGWNIRTRSDGSVAFDDTVNEVSGTWGIKQKASFRTRSVNIHYG